MQVDGGTQEQGYVALQNATVNVTGDATFNNSTLYMQSGANLDVARTLTLGSGLQYSPGFVGPNFGNITVAGPVVLDDPVLNVPGFDASVPIGASIRC
jgi:hypothetical protein